MSNNKIKTYDHERIIRSCFAEITNLAQKESMVAEAVALMSVEGRSFYKIEDSETGAMLGYEIEDSNRNSVKSFRRK